MTAFFTISGFLITFLSQVVGLDVSIHQLIAIEQQKPSVSLKPLKQNCSLMTNTSTEDELNKIELARVTGTCH